MSCHSALLVDDEEDFVDVLGMRLSARGFDVATAMNGEEALALASEKQFDVVVLDLTMPGPDGIETLKRLKKLDPHAQVILLTGYATEAKANLARELGAFDVMRKPANFPNLVARMNEACAKRRDAGDVSPGD